MRQVSDLTLDGGDDEDSTSLEDDLLGDLGLVGLNLRVIHKTNAQESRLSLKCNA